MMHMIFAYRCAYTALFTSLLIGCDRRASTQTLRTALSSPKGITKAQPKVSGKFPAAPDATFDFGENSHRARRTIDISRGLPPRITVRDIIGAPAIYKDRVVTVSGCYTVDPYHGTYLSDPRTVDYRALPMF